MKKIWLLVISMSLFLSSCLKEDKDFFQDSASDRMEQYLIKSKEILKGAANGWTMSCYPSPTQEFGGYTLFLKFGDGDKVTVASELENADKTETSLYTIASNTGPVLSFNTYNSMIHYFSEPRNRDGIGADDSGMRGDYEFVILEATPEKVTLKGTKTGNKVILTPVQAGASWTALVQQYKDAAKSMSYSKYDYIDGSKTATVTTTYRTLTFTYTGADAAVETQKVAYRYTPTGLEFYTPVTVGDHDVSEMTYVDDGENFYFIDAKGSGAKLTAIIPSLSQQLISGNWYFAYSALGSFAQPYWDQGKVGIDREGEVLQNAYLGIRSGKYGFHFQSNGYAGGLYFDYDVKDNNKVQLTYKNDGDGNGLWYFNNAYFNYMIYPIRGTFTLSTDHKGSPSWMLLTDDNRPNNSIKLYPTQVSIPFTK
jgi:hypothetical protein